MRVALLVGGRSSEHDVSLASGEAIREGLRAGGHEPLWIEIDREGVWRREGESEPLELTPGRGLLDADVAFPALHGKFGEDGTVQGLLEMLDVPYVGAGLTASALCIDKVLFKDLMAAAGDVPQVGYVDVRQADFATRENELLAQIARLGLPVFVKPSRMGSSVGIVRVNDPAAIREAIEGAFRYDARVIVEAAAPGIEVECAVLGLGADDAAAARAGSGQAAFVSTPGEIVFDADFYDYEAKYAAGGMELLVPARISMAAVARVHALALEAFARTGCEGLARVDFFVDGEQVLLNELNTMPGFTPTSVYAKLMQASGVPYAELLDRLCRLGVERHAAQAAQAF